MMQAQPNTVAEGLLEQLQDIHPVAEPSWWPPAPGWWVIAMIVLVALALVSIRLARRLKVRLRRRRLLRELDGLAQRYDPQTQPAPYLSALNRLFRGVAIRAFPESNCVRLEGREWVEFIRERLPGGMDVSGLEALETGPYQANPTYQPARLQDCARHWVLNHG